MVAHVALQLNSVLFRCWLCPSKEWLSGGRTVECCPAALHHLLSSFVACFVAQTRENPKKNWRKIDLFFGFFFSMLRTNYRDELYAIAIDQFVRSMEC